MSRNPRFGYDRT